MLATALVTKIRKRQVSWIPQLHDNSAGISERDRVRTSEMHFVVLLHSSLVFCETCGPAFLISGEGTHWVHGRRSSFPDLPRNLARSDRSHTGSKRFKTIHEFCQLSWTFHALIDFLDDGQASVQVSHCKISMGQAFVGQQFEGLLYHPMVTSDVTHHICKYIVYPWFSPYILCKSTVYCMSMSLLLCHPLPILVVTRRAWANGTTVHRNGFASLHDSGRWINIVWFSRICWGRLGEPSYLHQGQGFCADSAMHQRTESDNITVFQFAHRSSDNSINKT